MDVFLIWFYDSSTTCVEEYIIIMGCTSSLIAQKPIQKIEIVQPSKMKETACIQLIAPQQTFNLQSPEISDQEVLDAQIMNTKMKRQKEKIHFLQQSQDFMKESVEISAYVQQAIISLTYNPLLHDETYYRLIGVNKKTLEKKQNRMNNLVKREEKAQQELKKQREKRIEKTRSEIVGFRINTTKERKIKHSNKQNKEQNIYRTYSKESFAQKMSKIQHQLFGSQRMIS